MSVADISVRGLSPTVSLGPFSCARRGPKVGGRPTNSRSSRIETLFMRLPHSSTNQAQSHSLREDAVRIHQGRCPGGISRNSSRVLRVVALGGGQSQAF